MNQLFNFFLITVLFISCKQQVNSSSKEEIVNINSSTETLNKDIQEEQTIQEFLTLLKSDFEKNNIQEIIKKINNPFEFVVAGEIDYITDIEGLVKQSANFNKIIYARFYKENNGIYKILYDKEYDNTKEDPEGAFLIYFEAKKYENTFKLTSMKMPN